MAQASSLSALREDLRLFESGADRSGAPMWAIQDPVSNRFFRIGWLEYECLLRWPAQPEQIAADIEAHTPLSVEPEQVEQFARFLEFNQLLRPGAEGRQRLLEKTRDHGWRDWRWWLHNYLFLRVPLIRPQHSLERAMPWVSPLFTPTALFLLLLATLTGVLLVARQWDTFTHDVMDMLTPSGLFGFALALVLSKTLHELGHAFVATRLGVRVGHMGVAFLVMWPMLYTDTGESWRLRSHRQRLAISVAGVSTEMALAGVATLAWALLDDGALRQAMLYLATTGWVLSLALNVSPFMRFDGYFILSDLLDFPNLHERSGALARAWLRRTLLGLNEPDPEVFPARVRRGLILFAFCTWLYRLVMFLGIALAVYLFFFKVLGIFLLCVELIWFIGRPVWSEVSVWVKRWDEVRIRRRCAIGGASLAALALLAMPWTFDVEAPAVAQPQRVQQVFAPLPAQLQALRAAGEVKQGTQLVEFSARDLDLRAARSEASLQALHQRIGGLLAEEDGIAAQPALRERLQEQMAELSSVHEEGALLRILAEFDGVWLDVDPLVREGVWIASDQPLGVLVDPQAWVVDAYVEQQDVQRIALGNQARFRAENSLEWIPAQVLEIDTTRARELVLPLLADRHGGQIATHASRREAEPSAALYRVRLQLAQPLNELRQTRGSVHIEAESVSPLWSGIKSAAAVLLRESGF
ncbi:HlyD family efflux transporter periplasmic adaptor subunit [Ectopseudomonas mendocina]|uniref:HlyD family efflux transporter periplasmic adaptor subunit n=1 Tax=Ectopseudomonas mendocina TaxID=300 RepID=A0ABZ2RN06_ECTME